MGTYTKNLKLETPNYTDNADIPALAKKNNEIIDSEMIKRANGLDYNEQTGVLQLTGNNSKVGSPIQIKNNLPVTSMASGTELKVNNYKQLIKFTKEGKTEQKSYTGKNVIPLKQYNYTTKGVTVTTDIETGIITINGTCEEDNTAYVIYDDFILNGSYTFNLIYLSGTISNTTNTTRLHIADKDWGNQFYLPFVNSNNYTSRENISNVTYKNHYIRIDKGVTFNNYKVKAQLVQGTNSDYDFEPYVGGTQSPNPDYPQEIKNVRGVENIWFGGESTTNNGITFTKNADGSYDITGTATAEANCFNYINIANTKLKNGINYNLSINKLTNGKVIILTEAYANETWDSHVINALNTSNSFLTNKIINIKDNITRVRYGIRVEKGQTVNIKGLKIQLEEGPIAHNFVPNGSNYLQLKNVKKNLFDKNNLHFILGTVDVESITINNVGKSFYIKCKPNTTYTISRKIVGSRFVVGTTNGIPKQGEKVYDRVVNNAGSSITLTTSSNSNYLCVYYLLNSTENENNILDNIQIEEGSESTSYEQYQEKIINVDLKGNNLCSNKDKSVKDDLIVENGRAKIIKKYDEVVLNGSENWTKSGSSNSSRFIASLEITKIMKTKTFNALCNYFTYNIEFGIAKFHLFNTNTDGTARFIAFGVDPSTISDLTQWKALLKSLYDSGNPVKVQYELAEPEVIDLGEIDFDLIENSTLTCEEESDMQIDYLTIDSNIFVQDSLDGNSSQKAPSVDAIKKYFGKKVYDKDANGWIKIEFFDHTEYVTEGQITQIDFSTGWGVSKLLSLPVGMSTIGDRILSGNVRTFDAAISVNISGVLTETQITYNWKNNHSSNVTTGLNYSLRILEYV